MSTQGAIEKINNREYVGSKPFIAAIEKAAPKHIDPSRLARIAQTAVTKNPALLQCDRESFGTAVLQAAELGLDPGGALGHAYLVPYKNTCTLIVSFKGMVALARRSGEIVSIEARAVYERDAFDFEYGLDSKLKHLPYLDGDPGKLRFVYAVAKLKDGGVQFEVMTRTQIDAIRGRSRASSSGPWVTDYDEMAKKTVVRRLFKMLPVSVELASALADDDSRDFGEPANIGNVGLVGVPASSTGRTGEIETVLLPSGEQAESAPFKFATADAKKLAELVQNAPNPGELKRLESEIEKHAKSKGANAADVEELLARHKRMTEDYAATDAEAQQS